MYFLTLLRCSEVTKGPISDSGSSPGPIFKFSIFGLTISFILSPVPLPTGTTTEIAIHLSPAEPNTEPIIASPTISMSASGITTI